MGAARKVDPAYSAELHQYLSELGEQEFRKIRERKSDQLAVIAAKEAVFAEYLNTAIKNVFRSGVPAALKARKPPKAKAIKRVLNLVISDTHYGSDLIPDETGVSYGPVEEARRTAKVFDQAVNYKTEHRDQTGIVCHLMGDLIQGQLHDMRDGAPLAEQMARAIHILAQGLRYLSENFSRVVVPVTEGNHGRRKDRHPGRATFQKWDSNERTIYYALKKIAEHAGWTNVEFHMPKTPYYRVDVLGHSLFGNHGDTVLTVGNPHKNINVAAIHNKINEMMAAESAMGWPKTSVVLFGHVHFGSTFVLPSGVIVYTNPALIPPDNFSNSISIFNSFTGQWLIETTEAYAAGDQRLIRVDRETDQDSSLDQIISPYTGF